MRTTPTKSTVVFYVLKQLLLLQCVRHLQKKYLKQLLLFVFFVCIKTITSFTVRTTPTKSTAAFCVLTQLFLLQYDIYTKYCYFLCVKTITSFTVRTTPTKIVTVVSLYLKQLLLLQCVRYLQKVRLISLY